MAGFGAIFAVENDERASEAFQHNHPMSKVPAGGMSTFSDNEMLDIFAGSPPGIILGGPPRIGFSACSKNAGDPKGPRNSLFSETMRFGKIFSPALTILENAPNI